MRAHDGCDSLQPTDEPEETDKEWDLSQPTSRRYPDHLMPFVRSQEERDAKFAEAVEAFLVDYGYNTARAYRADLEDIYLWARERGWDFFGLTEVQLRRYQALLRRRKYSEGTVRRRGTAYRGFRQSATTAE